MKLIQPTTNEEKEIKDLVIVFHDIPNEFGKMESRKCVEFTIIGNNSEWTDYLYFEDFKETNPVLEEELSKRGE